MTKCGTCGAELTFGDWPFCGGKNSHSSILKTHAQRFAPIVYFQDKAGNKRFPGRSDAPPPKGFERVELRTVPEVRKFEREMNRAERERWDRHKVREELTFGPMRKQSRSELIAMMQSFSNLGKDFARLAMKKNDEKRRGDYDAQFRVEVLS